MQLGRLTSLWTAQDSHFVGFVAAIPRDASDELLQGSNIHPSSQIVYKQLLTVFNGKKILPKKILPKKILPKKIPEKSFKIPPKKLPKLSL